MAGATGGAGTAYLSVAHEFTLGCFVGLSMVWVQIPSREEQKFDSSKI
jgi:hypothetical protein